jgi:hypothetical protein
MRSRFGGHSASSASAGGGQHPSVLGPSGGSHGGRNASANCPRASQSTRTKGRCAPLRRVADMEASLASAGQGQLPPSGTEQVVGSPTVVAAGFGVTSVTLRSPSSGRFGGAEVEDRQPRWVSDSSGGLRTEHVSHGRKVARVPVGGSPGAARCPTARLGEFVRSTSVGRTETSGRARHPALRRGTTRRHAATASAVQQPGEELASAGASKRRRGHDAKDCSPIDSRESGGGPGRSGRRAATRGRSGSAFDFPTPWALPAETRRTDRSGANRQGREKRRRRIPESGGTDSRSQAELRRSRAVCGTDGFLCVVGGIKPHERPTLHSSRRSIPLPSGS